MVVKAPMPTVATTQPIRSTPPIVERMTLTPTDPSSDIRERASRLVTAHATAEPKAAMAPNVVCSIDPPAGAPRGYWTQVVRTPTIIR
jgi:hypothetical protein